MGKEFSKALLALQSRLAELANCVKVHDPLKLSVKSSAIVLFAANSILLDVLGHP